MEKVEIEKKINSIVDQYFNLEWNVKTAETFLRRIEAFGRIIEDLKIEVRDAEEGSEILEKVEYEVRYDMLYIVRTLRSLEEAVLKVDILSEDMIVEGKRISEEIGGRIK